MKYNEGQKPAEGDSAPSERPPNPHFRLNIFHWLSPISKPVVPAD